MNKRQVQGRVGGLRTALKQLLVKTCGVNMNKAESLINTAQQSDISIMRAEVECAHPSCTESSPFPEFPWGKIPDKEVKLL